jgi:hypothetical protein
MKCAWKMQTEARETGEDIRNSSQTFRKLAQMAGREREELHPRRS